MLTVDVTSIRNHSKELRSLASTYEVTAMSAIQELRNLDTEWHDDNSPAFFDFIETQKKEISKLTSSLEDICDRYDNIADETVAIDGRIRRVFCDQSFQTKVKNKYNNSINKISNLINSLQGASTYFCTSGERSAINNAKNLLSKAEKKLQTSRDKVDKLFTDLSRLETMIAQILNGIDVETLKELDLSRFLGL